MADNPNACGPPEWAARLDALCDHFPFVSEAHVLTMLTAAQGDAEVVAECLSEYPAARLFERWTFPGEFDACGLWRPVPQTAEPPAKFNWKHPDIYFDNDAPPSPGRTRSGQHRHRRPGPRGENSTCSPHRGARSRTVGSERVH